MVNEINPQESSQHTISTKGRGGPWLPAVLATIGVGVVLSGIFAGATGLYGDTGQVELSDMLSQAGKVIIRLALFSVLLLGAIRINAWRLDRPFGDVLLAALRCLAVVTLIEAVRVAQLPHGVLRLILIAGAQYIIFTISVMSLFVFTIREVVLFATGCLVGVAVLWLGVHLGSWIA